MKTIKPYNKLKLIPQIKLKKGDKLAVIGYKPYNIPMTVKKELELTDKGFVLEVEAKPTVDDITAFSQEIEQPNTIEDLMNSVIEESKQDDNKVTVTITLTKRQNELWLKKGGESWLKKALVGQGNKRKK